MFDILKMYSKKLNAQFKVTVYLPNDYDQNDCIYEACYILYGKDPFTDQTLNLENRFKLNHKIAFAIYPEKNISKNTLLYNPFKDEYGFSSLYEDFIINEIRPYLISKYRVYDDFYGNSIIGINETAILAYSLAYHHTMRFEKMYLYNLNLEGIEKEFQTDLISSFNPFTAIYFKTDNENSTKIVNSLQLLGSLEYEMVNSLDEIINKL